MFPFFQLDFTVSDNVINEGYSSVFNLVWEFEPFSFIVLFGPCKIILSIVCQFTILALEIREKKNLRFWAMNFRIMIS